MQLLGKIQSIIMYIFKHKLIPYAFPTFSPRVTQSKVRWFVNVLASNDSSIDGDGIMNKNQPTKQNMIKYV